MTLYSEKDSNIRKTWVIFTLFLMAVIGIGWIFSEAYGNPTILYVAVFFSIFMNVLAYWFSDKIVLKMAGAKEITHKEAPGLYNIVENLAITAGLPTPKIYIVPESQPNAFATGRNPKHAVVAVTEGLLGRLNKTELEGVIAHEMSHIGNRDMLLSTIIVVLVGFVSILSDIFLRSRFFGGFGRRDDREGNTGAIFAILGIVFAIFAPIALTLMQLAISRKREFLADASGALLTRYPEGLASALEKIASDPAPMKSANNTTAHLWLANPFKGKKISGLFMTHPPIEERIKVLRQLKI